MAIMAVIAFVAAAMLAAAQLLTNPAVRNEAVPFGIAHETKFEIYCDYALPENGYLVVDGKKLIRGCFDKGWPFEDIVKEAAMASSPYNSIHGYGYLKSYLIKGECYIFKTHEMKSFEVLALRSLSLTQLNCGHLLEDIGKIISGECPERAERIVSASAGTHACGIYEGHGYKIEQLSNGVETEWQAYIIASGKKIFSCRWESK